MHSEMRSLSELEDIVKELEEMTREVTSSSDSDNALGITTAADSGLKGTLERARKATDREERAWCEQKMVQIIVKGSMEPYLRGD
jgi:hypothetical protein